MLLDYYLEAAIPLNLEHNTHKFNTQRKMRDANLPEIWLKIGRGKFI